MPPTRTIPPAKAVKTERTHEENQERAYIAASRRSDRSLEARVESARRASEIHKRRTGRSLRVTEQDVINEEMYEEEDDDLPLQYRRLTAHLQTGSADFNRRLAAYLTNQVAMRSAVSQMAANPYAHQFQNQPPYQQAMFQSSTMPQQQQMPPSPNGMYRQSPYPSPHHPGFRQQPHGRAYSTMLPTKISSPPTAMHGHLERRMSTPAVVHPGASHINTEGIRADGEYLRQTQSAHLSGYFTQPWHDQGLFSAQLPPESQQMLAGTMDPNDPFSSMLMQGSDSFMSNPYYPWGDMHNGIKGMPVHPSHYPGMSATLAPSALDSRQDSMSTPSTSAPATVDGSVPSNGLDRPYHLKRENSHQSLHSGQITPHEGFWDNFVQDSSWHEEPTSV